MKYAVYGIFTSTKFLGEYEADTPEQAEEMAEASPDNYVNLCHQCVREIEMDNCSTTRFVVEKLDE